MVEANLLCLLNEIMRVNRDAVTAYASSGIMRHKRKWLCGSSFYHFKNIYSCFVKAFCHLINKGNVNIPECILHDFCRFSSLYAAQLNNISADYASVKLSSFFCCLFCNAADNPWQILNCPFFVARVYSLRAMRNKNVVFAGVKS